jgi:peptidoglycan/xylan/chitin deacetylase (PgdA/CDA1 family)
VSTTGQHRPRPRFASHEAKFRRRRQIAFAALVLIVAIPTLVVTAFRGSGSGPAIEDWAAGKVAPASARIVVSDTRQRAAVRRLLDLGLPIYCAGAQGQYVALTFDDGPSLLSPRFHELLRRAGARATFFIVGSNMKSATFAAYARADATLGALGNHTWLHTALAGLPEDGVVAEVGRTQRAIVDATGVPVLVFRPPFASRDSTVRRVVASYGMLMILWNTDSRDWSGAGWREVGHNVVRGLEPGSIVLMHDTRAQTLHALEQIILPELRRRHLRAVSLPELFALNPPSEAQLREDASRGSCSRGQYDANTS